MVCKVGEWHEEYARGACDACATEDSVHGSWPCLYARGLQGLDTVKGGVKDGART